MPSFSRVYKLCLILLLNFIASESVVYTINQEIRINSDQLKNNSNVISNINFNSDIDCLAVCSRQLNCTTVVYDLLNKKGYLMRYFLPEGDYTTNLFINAYFNYGLS